MQATGFSIRCDGDSERKVNKGKTVPCPHCQTPLDRQTLRAAGALTCAGCGKVIRSSARSKSKNTAQNVTTDPEAGGATTQPGEAALLPPRFLVPAAIARLAGIDEFANESSANPNDSIQSNPEFAVNPSILHIRTGSDLVPVVPVSRATRESRRRLRVLMIWLFSLAIFILLFWLLKGPGQADSAP